MIHFTFFQNTFLLGIFFAFKFRHVLEMFLTEDYKKNISPNTDYVPENEASIVRSLKNLYDLDPRFMLYKVIMKNYLNFYTWMDV